METAFTPIQSLSGGLMIGAAAVLLMWIHGRIAGATGILTGILSATSADERNWRIAMIAGMIAAPAAIYVVTGSATGLTVPVSTIALVIGGILVGIGVTLASGCTSGHGVCGMARLSPRSIVATATFMLVTGVTVYIVRHVVGG